MSFILSKNFFIRENLRQATQFYNKKVPFFSIELTILETQRVPSVLLIFYNVSMLFINCLGVFFLNFNSHPFWKYFILQRKDFAFPEVGNSIIFKPYDLFLKKP